MPKLKNPKHEIFCQEYVARFNGTQAAIKAGFSPKTADQQASRLLTKVKIKERVEELKVKREKRLEVTADKVIKEIARIAFFDTAKLYDENGNLLDIQDLDEDSAHAIAGIEFTSYGKDDNLKQVTKYRVNDKARMLELLTKHVSLDGLFKHAENIVVNNYHNMDIEELERITQQRLRKARSANKD
jgi:phage terminase small subunit